MFCRLLSIMVFHYLYQSCIFLWKGYLNMLSKVTQQEVIIFSLPPPILYYFLNIYYVKKSIVVIKKFYFEILTYLYVLRPPEFIYAIFTVMYLCMCVRVNTITPNRCIRLSSNSVCILQVTVGRTLLI